MERFAFENGMSQGGGMIRPAKSERKNRVFSAKRQAVRFETQSVSNWKCSKTRRRAGRTLPAFVSVQGKESQASRESP